MIWIALVLASVSSGWLLGRGDAAANARTAAEAAPAALLLAVQGVTLGLCARDRVRLRKTYASPTLSHLGKLAAGSGLSAAATFVLSPVAWPAEALLAGSAAVALGTCVWIGNLPSKL
jgi:hypothetical protein